MDAAYNYVGGFHSFDDEIDMVDHSLVWVLTYDGPEPKDVSTVDWNRVYCCTICKSKHGLKTVAFGQQSTVEGKAALSDDSHASGVDFKQRRASAVRQAMEWQAKHCWQEVSHKPEHIFLSMGAEKIPYAVLADTDVFKNKEVRPAADGYHYARKIGGQWVTKLAVGKFIP